MTKSKYTVNGDAAFDQMLDNWLEAIAEAVGKSSAGGDIAAILLGGGYGRGEGGVFEAPDGQKKLYNDLDFFVIAKNRGRSRIKKINRVLAVLGEKFSREIGVSVDFCPAKTSNQLARIPFTMMWQEMRERHLLVYGREDVLEPLPDYDLRMLPRSEGLRLLLNRGTGLLFVKQRFGLKNLTTEDRDFIGRNLYKAVLACGDVFLLLHHKYCLSVGKRLQLLEELGKDKLDAEDMELYRDAVRFKFSPEVYSFRELTTLREAAMALFEKTCLYFFSVCCNLAINNLQELKLALNTDDCFSKDAGIKDLVKNFILNVIYTWRFDRHFLFSPASPRLKLLEVLLGLLFEDCSLRSYITYVRYWNRFN